MKRRRAAQPRRNSPKRRVPAESAPVRLIGGQYQIVSRWPVVALAVLTYLLSLPIFEPQSVWPLAYVFLVPWVTAVSISRRSAWVYLVSLALGLVFFLTHWRWLYSTTPPGYIAGSFILSVSFPLAAWPLRHLYRKRKVSLAIALPIVWTTIELLRSHGPHAFPWFLLGHTQVRLLTMIQIADLTGVYGVSFVVAAVNGWVADLLLRPILIWQGGKASAPRIGPAGTAVMLVALGATIIYGRLRLAAGHSVDGPRIAVVQGDFLLSPDDFSSFTDLDKRGAYLDLLQEAARDAPDMFVLPETPWALYLNRELRELRSRAVWGEIGGERRGQLAALAKLGSQQHKEFLDLSQRHRASIVVGAFSQEPQPDGSNPLEHRYNSAFVYTPGMKEAQRYDKIFLVLLGEYVPFRYSRWLKPLYSWLNSITPWGAGGYEYSLTAGTEYKTFAVQERSPGGNAYNFAVTICYEDAIPQVFRRFVMGGQGKKRVDFMLNISNDGWFGHGTQQAQHLATCAFRAVENRVGIARAVNTGISGFINSDGSWYKLVGEASRELRGGGTGHRTARVVVDRRVTCYSRYGDVFGLGCAVLTLAALADALISGLRGRWPLRSARTRRAEP